MRPGFGLNNSTGQTSQAGSVILEAMIAILIFSIGILGLIGMQAAAVNNVSDAKYRADASFLADQIVGQMWASRVAVTTAGVTSYAIDPTYAWNVPGATPNPIVTAWAANGVAAYLPNASAVVSIAPGQQNVTVMISWLPPKSPAGTAPHVHTVNSNIF